MTGRQACLVNGRRVNRPRRKLNLALPVVLLPKPSLTRLALIS